MNTLMKSAVLFIMASTVFSGSHEGGLWHLAMAKEKVGDYTAAIALYEKALSGKLTLPDKARVLYRLGACQTRVGKSTAALKTFRRLLAEHAETDPHVVKLLKQLAAAAEYVDGQKLAHVEPHKEPPLQSTKKLLQKTLVSEYAAKDVVIDAAVKKLRSALAKALPNTKLKVELLHDRRPAEAKKKAVAKEAVEEPEKASFDFTDLPVEDLVRYISQRYGYHYYITAQSVVIHDPQITGEKMITQSYYFDPRVFSRKMKPQAFIAKFGVQLPVRQDGKAATVKYDQNHCRLTMYNTRKNHEVMKQIARMMRSRGIPMVKVTATLIQAELPAEWRKLPAAEISGQLLLSLPASKLEVLDVMSLICQSGEEAFSSNKARMRVPGIKERPLVEQGMVVTPQVDSYWNYISVDFHWYRRIWTKEMLARRRLNLASEVELPTLSKDIRTDIVLNDGRSQVIRFEPVAKSTRNQYLIITATDVDSRGRPHNQDAVDEIRKESGLLKLILSQDWL